MRKFSYRVWYFKEEDREDGYFKGMPKQYKYVKAFNMEDAWNKFKEKYPELHIGFVEGEMN